MALIDNQSGKTGLIQLFSTMREKLMGRESKQYEGLEPTGSADMDLEAMRRRAQRRKEEQKKDK